MTSGAAGTLSDEDVPAWWHALGLPGLFDVHVHFLPPRMQAAYGEILEAEQKWLARVLDQGRQRGVFAFAGSAEEEALVVSSALQGALQIARASRRIDRFDSVAQALQTRLTGVSSPAA